MTLDEQIDEILKALPRRHRVPFLAGVRFAQGHVEHGAALFAKSTAELERDEREERADEYTYRRRRRWLQRQPREVRGDAAGEQ